MNNRKALNVFQSRIYDLYDNLIDKSLVADLETGQKKIIAAFNNKTSGPFLSHATIRCLDILRKDWIVPVGGGHTNDNAAFFDPETTVADKWKIAIYDLADNRIFLAQMDEPITEQIYNLLMLNNAGAFYCVISAHDIGAPADMFTVASVNMNTAFNLMVETDDKYDPHMGLDALLAAFAKPLEDDRAETAAILKSRQKLEEQ